MLSFYATKYFSDCKQLATFKEIMLVKHLISTIVFCLQLHFWSVWYLIHYHCPLVLTNIRCTMFDLLFYVDAVVNVDIHT